MNLRSTRAARKTARTLGAAIASGLLGMSLLAVAASSPASALQTNQTEAAALSWGASDLIRFNRMGLATLWPGGIGDGATCTDAAPAAAPNTAWCSSIDWTNGTGARDADGNVELVFPGTVAVWAKTGAQWVTLSDLEFSFDATGAGEVTAVVEYGTTAAYPTGTWDGREAKPESTPTRVPVVDLLADPNPVADDGQFDDYPYSDAFTTSVDDAGVTTFENLRGLWSNEFLAHLHGPDGVPDSQPTGEDPDPSDDGFVYASVFQNLVDGSSRVRYPAPFAITAAFATAQTDVTATLSKLTQEYRIDVAGSGFAKSGTGIYVSVRESEPGDPAWAGGTDGVIGGESQDLSRWIAAAPNPVAHGAIAADGSFTTTLTFDRATLASLDPAKVYTVVTQKAHGQGTLPQHASQLTETPVDFDFDAIAALPEASAIEIDAPAVTHGTAANVTVTVAGTDATPQGHLWLVVSNQPVAKKLLDEDGSASFALPTDLAGGKHSVTAIYGGDDNNQPTETQAVLTVRKATTSVSGSWAKRPTTRAAGTAKVRVPATSGGATPTGRAWIQLRNGSTVRNYNSALVNGTATIRVPKQAAGRWVVKVRYASDRSYRPVPFQPGPSITIR